MAANATEFFDNLGKAISKTADMVVKKTDEFISIQKLRSHKSVLEAKLDNTFKRIGETVYEGRENGTEYPEEIERLCHEIDVLRREIAVCKAEIAERKGEKICPDCGASVPKEACFCMQCGRTMNTGEKKEGKAEATEQEISDMTPEVETESASETEAESSAADGTAQEQPSESGAAEGPADEAENGTDTVDEETEEEEK